jgi:hypothetical protein
VIGNLKEIILKVVTVTQYAPAFFYKTLIKDTVTLPWLGI